MNVEHLDLDLGTPADTGLCCICRMTPMGRRLDLGLQVGSEHHHVIVCRHCLSEYAPDLLVEIERPL